MREMIARVALRLSSAGLSPASLVLFWLERSSLSERTLRIAGRKLLSAARPLSCFALLFVAWATLQEPAFAAIPANVSVLQPTVTAPNLKRVALVIGNGAYENVPKLANPVNDARSVAEKLQGLGYQVYFAQNLGRLDFDRTIGTFLQQVGPGTQTLVYYAGHGVELNGSNYLIPVDIPELSPNQKYLLRTEAVNLTDLLLELKARGPQVTLVILDACRDNPFQVAGMSGTRSLGQARGLGRVDPPQGAFVIYSAGVGEEALDNLGPQDKSPHGLFTRKLLTLMDKPGLEIRPMVQQLRAEVRQAALRDSGHDQTPSYYDQLLGQFYFMPKSLEQPGTNACDQLVDPKATADAVLADHLEDGLQACARAVAEHPEEPRFVHLLQAAQEQQTFQRAVGSDKKALSNAYMILYPQGRYATEVRNHLASLGPVVPPSPGPEIVPPQPAPLDKPEIAPEDIARVLQSELERVGCDPGPIDGNWGDKSVRALRRFSVRTHANLDVNVPNLPSLQAVRQEKGVICQSSPRPRKEVNVPPSHRSHDPLTLRHENGCMVFNGMRVCG
jgi:hypothetical protein